MQERRKRRQLGRVLLLAAGAFLLTTFARPLPLPLPARPAVAPLFAEPVILEEGNPGRRHLGALEFLSGWSLISPDLRFGAISSMHVGGGRVLALSDSGVLFDFPVPKASREAVRIAPLRAGPGDGRRKSARDSEALFVHGDQRWVAFENRHEVWRYGADWRAQAHAAPGPMQDWYRNAGAEAMVRLPDGQVLVLAEGASETEEPSPALLFSGDPARPGTGARRLSYRAPAGYRPTDAALLPDGRVLVLNRSFSLLGGFRVKLTAMTLGARGVLEGREIAAFEPPVVADNLEALSVTQEGGRTILWMASDDNYSPFQRTLLLKFALAQTEAPAPTIGRRGRSDHVPNGRD